jgi:hypothetical protein
MADDVYTGFWWGDPTESDHLKDLRVDVRIILKRLLNIWDRDTDWIDLAHDRDRWQTLVNAVMNLRVP